MLLNFGAMDWIITSRCFLLLFLTASSVLIVSGDGNVDVLEGKSVTLECRFNPTSSQDDADYFWTRATGTTNPVAYRDKALDENYQIVFSPSQGRYDLRIMQATYDRDNGRFECKVKQKDFIPLQTTTVTVLLPPKSPEISPISPLATEGENLDLTCSSVGGSPSPDIIWYRRGNPQPLKGTYTPGENKDVPTVSTLTVVPGKEDDGAEYICEVWSRALTEGRKLKASTRINVNYYPRFTIGPFNPLLVERNAAVAVTCDVDAKPPPSYVRWTRNGQVLSSDRTLVVRPGNIRDNGAYFCESSNGLGEPKKSELKVEVLFGPVVQVVDKKEAGQGDTVAVFCNVTANPPASTIEWIKEGDDVFHQRGDTLRFHSIRAEDTGRYICRATNVLRPSGADSSIDMVGNATTAVLVRHRPGKTTIVPSDPVASEGEPFNMMCRTEPAGWPEPTYKWWREGSNVTLSLGLRYAISVARMSHEGIYHCRATNELGESDVATATLRVFEPPRLISQLQPQVTRKVGQMDLSISCSARGNPSPNVRWLKDGEDLIGNRRYEIYTHDNGNMADSRIGYHIVESTLKFFSPDRPMGSQLMAEDRGHYTCQFENEVKAVGTTMLLRIEHAPILMNKFDKVAFDIGETAKLECHMQAFPEPQFEWVHNGSPISRTLLSGPYKKYDSNVTVITDSDMYTSLLIVRDVQRSDMGEYVCKAVNNIGQISAEIRLQEKGSPEKPRNVEVIEVGFDEATIRWVDGFHGGYVNTTYSIQANATGDSRTREWDCQINNPCNISGLDQHTTYFLHVQAHNFKGWSPFSDKIEFTTKVNVEDIPAPLNVEFNKDSKRVEVRVRQTNMAVIGRVDYKVRNDWIPYAEPIHISNGRGSVLLHVPQLYIDNVRVTTCLQENPLKCGSTREASASVSLASLSEQEIIGIGVGCAVFAALVIIIAFVICYCYRRNSESKNKKTTKKDYEMDPSNRPKIISPPTYHSGGIINKGADHNVDPDTSKMMMGNHYGPPPPHAINGRHMMNGVNGHISPGYPPYLGDGNSQNGGGSVDSQDSLWRLKTGINSQPGSSGSASNAGSNGPYDMGPNGPGPYVQYEPHTPTVPVMPPQYVPTYHPDDYHMHHDDMMNQRNRDHIVPNDPYAAVNKPKKRVEHMDSPYHDVSGLPDPYNIHDHHPHHLDDDGPSMHKQPHLQLSFDESLESGYSTPNSRSRRVIREIIV